MQKDTTISTLLGLKQEELAMVLKINRSQWSMYASGKRDLPAAAKMQLAEMLRYVQDTTSKSVEEEQHTKEQLLEKKKILEEAMANNRHNQMLVEKKIQAVEKKYKVNVTTLKLMGYLEQQSVKKSHQENQLLKGIQAKAEKELEKKSWSKLFQHQFKQELLQAEEKFLKTFFENLR